MSIFGPRLDRPSAVGDEGRPRATSLSIAAVVVVGLALVTFYHLGAVRATTSIGFAVGIYVAGMALLGRRRIRDQVVGHLLFHGGAGVLLVVAISGWIRLPHPIVLGGFVLALFGLAGTWADVLSYDGLDEVMNLAPISYGALLISLAALYVLVWGGSVVAGHLGTLFGSTDPSTALFGFLAWVAVAAFVVLVAIRVVPFRELLPRRNRPELTRRVARLKRTAAIGGATAVAGTIVAGVVGTESIDGFADSNLAIELLLVVLSSPLVVGPLVILSLIGALAVVASLGATRVTALLVDGAHDRLAGAIAGILLAALVAFFVVLARASSGTGGAIGVGLVVGVALVATLLVLIAHALGLAALDVGILPDRAAGPATCATGLLVAAVGAGLAGLPAPIVFGCVAGAVLVWDLSTFGLALTVELGHRPDTRRLELYHGLLSVGVGLAAVVAATLLDRVRRSVDPISGPWSAVALAVLGAMLLAFALSRREG